MNIPGCQFTVTREGRDQKCSTPVFYPQVSDSVVPTSIFQKNPPETADANCAETFSVCMEFSGTLQSFISA
ncbi:hypothetical protein CapIbe_008163 [Capra ibex]